MDLATVLISAAALAAMVVFGYRQGKAEKRLTSIEEWRRDDEEIVRTLLRERKLGGWVEMTLGGQPGDHRRRLEVVNKGDGTAAYLYVVIADDHIEGDGRGVFAPHFPLGGGVHHLGLLAPRAKGSVDILIPSLEVTEFSVLARWKDGIGEQERLSERFYNKVG